MAHSTYARTWYIAAFSKDLAVKGILNTTVAGQRVTLYRTAGGRIRAIEPTCPHLGIGGFVDGENIHCPFHHFGFAPDGACISTGWGAPPPKAALTHYAVHEANGLVYVWTHPTHPAWTPETVDTTPYRRSHTWSSTFRGHPYDIAENATDFQHFRFIHDMEPPTLIGPFTIDKHTMTIPLSMPSFWSRFPTRFSLRFEGPALFAGHITIPNSPYRAVEVGGMTHHQPDRATFRKIARATIDLPVGPLKAVTDQVLSWATGRASARQVGADIPIWENRRFLPHPHLTDGEQQLAACRRWLRQFFDA